MVTEVALSRPAILIVPLTIRTLTVLSGGLLRSQKRKATAEFILERLAKEFGPVLWIGNLVGVFIRCRYKSLLQSAPKPMTFPIGWNFCLFYWVRLPISAESIQTHGDLVPKIRPYLTAFWLRLCRPDHKEGID